MNKQKKLFLIIILAIALRFIGLEKFSPPLNRDEAGLAYNAYSLLQTGQDEHSQSWPLSFESIGDYKMPGYIYLSLLPIKLFGLNVFPARFCSSLFGVLAVVAIYFLSEQISILFKNPKIKKYLALVSAFLLTINPWHIHYSRISFEANVNLTLFLFALLFFFKAQKKAIYYILSSLFFVVMQFMYSSTFIFLPFFVISLFFIFNPKQVKNKKNIKFILISLLIFVIGSSIALKSVAQVSQAKSSITVFSDPTILEEFRKKRVYWNEKNPLIAKILFNQNVYILTVVAKNYLKSFSPGFLLFNKINHPWHAVLGQGFFYYLDILFFLLGLFFLIKNYKKFKKIISFLFVWLLSSPIASAITVDAPHATRSLYFIPIILIISSIGITKFLPRIKYFILIFYLIFFSKFLYQYIYIYPQNYPDSFLPESKQVFEYLEENHQGELIYVDNFDNSIYLNYLFYQKIDPIKVQQNAIWSEKNIAGLFNIKKLDNYHFIENFNDIDSGILVKQIKRKDDLNQFNKVFYNRFDQPKWGIIVLK